MKRLTVTALLLLLCSCDKTSKQQSVAAAPAPAPAPAPFRQPSATELFDLQSKCTAMGVKVLEGDINGDTLSREQVSHYNPKDNRCYVKLIISTGDLREQRENYERTDYLYDGQSNEMLAYVTKGKEKVGMVFDTGLLQLMQEKKQSSTDFDAIGDLIDSFVSTDRRQ